MSTQAPIGPYEAAAAPVTLTRQRILEAAAQLFYRRGIRAVNVDTLAEQAGTTKVTLYRHFRSKDELIASCLRMLDDRFFSWFVQEVSRHSEKPAERLLAVFDVLTEWFERDSFRGCAFINAAVELADPSHPAHEAVVAHKRRSRAYFRELAEAARLPDPAGVADQWMLLTEGAIVTALVEDDRTAARQGRQAAALLLSGASVLPAHPPSGGDAS
jgi:AcrR family transcriptional regulator